MTNVPTTIINPTATTPGHHFLPSFAFLPSVRPSILPSQHSVRTVGSVRRRKGPRKGKGVRKGKQTWKNNSEDKEKEKG